MKTFFAAVLLLGLTACNPVRDTPSPSPPKNASGKPLPYAPPPPMPDEGIFCAADVRQCPDGKFVSRNPEKACSFDPCPGEPTP